MCDELPRIFHNFLQYSHCSFVPYTIGFSLHNFFAKQLFIHNFSIAQQLQNVAQAALHQAVFAPKWLGFLPNRLFVYTNSMKAHSESANPSEFLEYGAIAFIYFYHFSQCGHQKTNQLPANWLFSRDYPRAYYLPPSSNIKMDTMAMALLLVFTSILLATYEDEPIPPVCHGIWLTQQQYRCSYSS